MAKYDRLVISGEQQQDISASALARVVIMLARRWLHRSTGDVQQTDNEEATS
jgi:hypothetical protein